jgi:hypothetical protein
LREDEMGGAMTQMGQKMHIEFWWKNMKEVGYLEDLAVGRKQVLKFIL